MARRSREIALKREDRECDEVIAEYTELLRELDPKLAKKYSRSSHNKAAVKLKTRKPLGDLSVNSSSTFSSTSQLTAHPFDADRKSSNNEWRSATSQKVSDKDADHSDDRKRSKAKLHPYHRVNRKSTIQLDERMSSRHAREKSPAGSIIYSDIEATASVASGSSFKSSIGVDYTSTVEGFGFSQDNNNIPASTASDFFDTGTIKSSYTATAESKSLKPRVVEPIPVHAGTSSSVNPKPRGKPLISTMDSRQSRISADSLDQRSSYQDESVLSDDVPRKSPFETKEILDDDDASEEGDDLEDTLYLSDERPSAKTFPPPFRALSSDKSSPSISSTIQINCSQPKSSWQTARPKHLEADIVEDFDARMSKNDETYRKESDFNTRLSLNQSDIEDEVLLATKSRYSNSKNRSAMNSSSYSSDVDLRSDSSDEPHSSISPLLTARSAVRQPRTVVVNSTSSVGQASQGSSFKKASSSPTDLQWISGRASLDLIEIAQAMDVLISSVSLSSDAFPSHVTDIRFQYEFLGRSSALSKAISRYPDDKVSGREDSMIPVNFPSHLIFDEVTSQALTQDIEDKREALSLTIALHDDDGDVLGIGQVNLWVMIEDSCNIIRREIDIISSQDGRVIASALVDVRGFHLLSLCAS
jgi:hypothetical protein